MVPVTENEAPEGGGEEGEEGSSLSPQEIGMFVLRAARLHLPLCLAVALMIGVLGATIVAAIPPVYDATFRIFIQESGPQTSALTTGRERYRPLEGARGLEEFILARDNLLSIVREAKLIEKWPSTRAVPMRVKDQVSEALFGPPSRRDMERGFVEMLATSIKGAKDGESVTVHAQWRDKQSAYDIAKLVQRNFLTARAAHDFGPIQRAIPFLEGHLEQADLAVDSAIAKIQNLHPKELAKDKPKPKAASGESAPAPASTADETSLVELATLSRELSATRRELRTLNEPWKRRVTELKTQLVDMKVSYSDEHPLVMQLEARIEAASQVPEEMATLRAREAELVSKLSASTKGSSAAAAAAAAALAVGGDQAASSIDKDDPELALARSRLVAALRKSEQVSERLEAARIELATAEADFKHRYVVVEQPEVPDKPFKSKKPLLFAAAFLVSILLGLLSGALRELMSGRLTEIWQVRSLGLPLLADVELRKLPSEKN